jgi:hypothetical protein
LSVVISWLVEDFVGASRP